MLSVQVFEQRSRGHVESVAGQHVFRVRVTNQSEEAVRVDSISLSYSSNVIRFQNADQVFNEILEAGQTSDFPMWVDVTAMPMSYVYTIDSVDVSITCHSTTRGNFSETGSHSVGAE